MKHEHHITDMQIFSGCLDVFIKTIYQGENKSIFHRTNINKSSK